MLDVTQLRQFIIVPALNLLQMYSKPAEELLVFTCATESKGGTYIKQVGGPALGVYQMEPKTYMDIWNNYITRRTNLMVMLAHNFKANRMDEADRMIWDLMYSTAMARIFYRRINEEIPNETDVNGLWEYYKKYYNTELGKATKDESIKAYMAFTKREK